MRIRAPRHLSSLGASSVSRSSAVVIVIVSKPAIIGRASTASPLRRLDTPENVDSYLGGGRILRNRSPLSGDFLCPAGPAVRPTGRSPSKSPTPVGEIGATQV